VSSEEEEGVLELLRTVRPPGSATVLVTHSRRVADSADRTVHLLDGRVA
jgi:ABC-type lipoprotein export system ATPase subunit